ncbi:hypothetical protein [Aeoliella sp.]|uniref:hypothetical protein n=1 Tax=Aeoliella sp. TaxID=2795800 RepID=UPI003CCC30F9
MNDQSPVDDPLDRHPPDGDQPEGDKFSAIERQPLEEGELATARAEYRMLKWLMVVALWVSCAVALAFNLADPDLWGHVRYGQDAIRSGQLHRTATHTYTAADHPWVNHEVLAELTYASLFDWFGVEGLLLFKLLVGLGILAGMAWVAARHGVKVLTIAVFLLLVANNFTPFFTVRPQLFSFACCAMTLVVLDLAFTGWSLWLTDPNNDGEQSRHDICTWRHRQLTWLLLLVPIGALWANSHGAFLAGVGIAVAYLLGRSAEAIRHRRWQSVLVVSVLLFIAAAMSGATLLNAYGADLHRWLLMSLGSPRPEISEWTALRPKHVVFWPFVILSIVSVSSLALTRRSRDWVQIALLVVVAWQSIQHQRHIAFFVLLCGFWIPPHLQSALARLRPDTSKLNIQRLGPWWRWGVAALLAIVIGVQGNTLYGRLSVLPVYRSMYPVDAVQWMTFKQINGRMIVAFGWAQYAIAALSPETTVAFDGRFRTCYPQEVVDKSFDFQLGDNRGYRYRRAEAGPLDPTAILEFGDPELVLVDRLYKNSVQVMEFEAAAAAPQWTLLYQDGLAQLWGRALIYDNPNSPRYIAPAERLITDKVHFSAFNWPALPVPSVIHPLAKAQTDAPPTPTEEL